jgi:hypothetical protein
MQQLEFYTTLKDRSLLREGNIMYQHILCKTYVNLCQDLCQDPMEQLI